MQISLHKFSRRGNMNNNICQPSGGGHFSLSAVWGVACLYAWFVTQLWSGNFHAPDAVGLGAVHHSAVQWSERKCATVAPECAMCPWTKKLTLTCLRVLSSCSWHLRKNLSLAFSRWQLACSFPRLPLTDAFIYLPLEQPGESGVYPAFISSWRQLQPSIRYAGNFH